MRRGKKILTGTTIIKRNFRKPIATNVSLQLSRLEAFLTKAIFFTATSKVIWLRSYELLVRKKNRF